MTGVISTIAAQAYRQRQAHARRKVEEAMRAQAAGGGSADKGWTREQADAKLRPWLAIASLVTGSTSEDRLRMPELFEGTRDPLALSLAARPIPRAEALAALAEARNAAIESVDPVAAWKASGSDQRAASANARPSSREESQAGGCPRPASEGAIEQARNLMVLANYLGAPPYPYRSLEKAA